MAFRVNNDWSDSPPLAQEVFADGWFNVTQAVGSKEVGTGALAPNRITDAQLLYYFIYYIYRDGDKTIYTWPDVNLFDPGNYPTKKTWQTPLLPEIMEALVYKFQTDLRNHGKSVFIDGRCDRAFGKIASISKTGYTIIYANYYYAHTIRLSHNRTDWQDFMMADRLLPNELHVELQMTARTVA